MRFVVEMRSILADGRESSFQGVVDAPNVLNAVGQACLRFGVRTDTLVYLKVEVEDKQTNAENETEVESGPKE